MKARPKRLAWIFIPVLLVLVRPGGSAGEEPRYTERDRNVARTIFAVISKKLRDEAPGPDLLRAVKELGEDEDLYSYEYRVRSTSHTDREVVRWAARIDFNEKWRDVERFVPTEKQRKLKPELEPGTGATILFVRKTTGPRRASKVRFYLVRSGVFLRLTLARPVSEDRAEVTARGLALWHVLVRAAEAYGLLGNPPISIVPLGGDLRGQEMENGEIVQFARDLRRPGTLRFEIGGRPAGLRPGEPHTFDIRMDDAGRRILSASGKGVTRTDDGYQLKSTEERSVVVLDYPKLPGAIPTSELGHSAGPTGVFPVRISDRKRKKTIGIQIVHWEAVLAVFQPMPTEIMQRPRATDGDRTVPGRVKADGERVTWEEIGSRIWPKWDEIPENLQRMVEKFEHFAEDLPPAGSLFDTWSALLKMVAARRVRTWSEAERAAGKSSGIREFHADDPVVAGWMLTDDLHSFIYAVADRPDGPLLNATFVEGIRLRFTYDLLIDIREKPKGRVQSIGQDEDFGDGGKPAASEEGDAAEVPKAKEETDATPPPGEELSPLELRNRGRKARRTDYKMVEFSVTVHRVDEKGEDWRAVANRAVEAEVATGPTGGKDGISDCVPLPSGLATSTNHYAGTDPWMPRDPGIYEARFHAIVVRRNAESHDERKVDAAIRFRIVDQAFKVKILHGIETKRVK
jgi:hypothetical protein